MATEKHNGSFTNNSIVGYVGLSSNFYGYRLLKYVYVGAADVYVWLGQYGRVDRGTNVWTPDSQGEGAIQVLTVKDIKDSYGMSWTPDLEYKKGDILTGEGTDGTRVVLLYISETRVERLTPFKKDAYSSTGHGTLAFYQDELKNIQVLKASLDGTKFSEV